MLDYMKSLLKKPALQGQSGDQVFPETQENIAQDSALGNWNDIRRRQTAEQMQWTTNTLVQLHVVLSQGVLSDAFPDEFRDHVKRQLLQIAATVEVEK